MNVTGVLLPDVFWAGDPGGAARAGVFTSVVELGGAPGHGET